MLFKQIHPIDLMVSIKRLGCRYPRNMGEAKLHQLNIRKVKKTKRRKKKKVVEADMEIATLNNKKCC